VTPLTDAQIREYIAFLYGPDEPAPPIVDASDDALEPFPLPTAPSASSERWARIHRIWAAHDRYKATTAPDDDTAPLPVPPNPNDVETWADVIQPPTPESD
jgi:hypothetical protein